MSTTSTDVGGGMSGLGGILTSSIGSIATLLQGLIGDKSYKKTQDELNQEALSARLSEYTQRGVGIMNELGNTGLQGYNQMKQEVDSQIPTTLNEAKDYLSSGGLVDALSKIYTQSSAQKRDLGVANANALLENKQKLASYLGQVAGPQDTMASDEKRKIDLLKIANQSAQSQNTQDLLSGGIKGLTKMLGGSGNTLYDMIFGKNNYVGGVSMNIPTGSEFNSNITDIGGQGTINYE